MIDYKLNCVYAFLEVFDEKKEKPWNIFKFINFFVYHTSNPPSTLAFPVCLLRYLGTPKCLLVVFQNLKVNFCQKTKGLEIYNTVKILDKSA